MILLIEDDLYKKLAKQMVKLKYFVTDNPSLGLPVPVLRVFNDHARQMNTILGEH